MNAARLENCDCTSCNYASIQIVRDAMDCERHTPIDEPSVHRVDDTGADCKTTFLAMIHSDGYELGFVTS